MLKTIIGKLEKRKRKYNDLNVDVALLKRNNNTCYASAFRQIYIDYCKD